MQPWLAPVVRAEDAQLPRNGRQCPPIRTGGLQHWVEEESEDVILLSKKDVTAQ